MGGIYDTQQIIQILEDKWWAVTLVFVILFIILSNVTKSASPAPAADEEVPKKEKKQKQTPPPSRKPVLKDNEPYSTHPLFYKHCKVGGKQATAEITSVSVNPTGRVLVGCDDHSFVIFDGVFKDGPPVQKRVSVGRDSPVAIAASTTHAVIALDSNKCELYKLLDTKAELLGETEGTHKKDISSVGIGERFFVSCSEDTEFKVWSLSVSTPPNASTGKSSLLSSVNTNQMQNYMAAVSPDSKFIGVAAFTSDVRLWEVAFKKTGEFEAVRKAIELKGHKKGINCIAFSNDSTRVATASKDGSWRLWRVNVRYAIGEDPECELVVQTPYPSVDRVVFNPTKAVVVSSFERTLQFWDSKSGKLLQDLPDAVKTGSVVSGLAWSSDGKFLLVSTKSGLVVWQSPV
jgi:WD40 repeat protein